MNRIKLNPKRPPLSAFELDPDDPSVREQRAILELLRSLNIGKLIAYVGSGVSAIYGYLSWTDLATTAARLTFVATKKWLSRKDDGIYFTILDQLTAIAIEIECRKENVSTKVTDTELMALTSNVLAILKTDSDPSGPKSTNPTKHTESVEDLVKEVQADEPNAKTEVSLEGNSDDIFRKARENLEKPKGAELNYPGKHIYDVLQQAIKKLFEGHRHLENGKLLPAELASAYRLSNPKKPVDDKTTEEEARNKARLGSSRNSIDPIHTMIRRLRIHRFATLNYDLEIEKCLEDLDYPYDTLTKDERAISHAGAIGSSLTLKPDNSPQLLAFAAKPISSSSGHQIVHIHGSIKDAESMVVFQGDYNALYVNTNRKLDSFQDALHIMFNGNAVLFLGIGMSEDDVMRPIRLSLPHAANLPLFSLMPSCYSTTKNLAAFEHNKTRYGVNTIIYGRSRTDIPETWYREPLGDRPFTPTEVRLRDKNIDVREAVSLHQELKEISDVAIKIKNNARKWKLKLEQLLNASKSPRISSWLAFDEFKSKLFSTTAASRKKLNRFVEYDLPGIATAQAFDDVLHFMSDQADKWREKWKLNLNKDNLPSDVLHHGCIANPISNPEIFKEVIDEIRKESSLILQIGDGRGKGMLFSLMVDAINKNGQNIDCSFAFSGANTLFFRLFDRVNSVIDGGTVFIHNADSLMDRHRSRARSRSLEQFFLHLFSRAHRYNGIKVVVSCTTESTRNYLRSLRRHAQKRTRKFAQIGPFQTDLRKSNTEAREAELAKKFVKFASDKSVPYEYEESIWMNQFRSKISVRWTKNSEHLPDSQKYGKIDIDKIIREARLGSINPRHRGVVILAGLLAKDDDIVYALKPPTTNRNRAENVLRNTIMKWLFAFTLPTEKKVLLRIPEVGTVAKSTGEECKDLLDTTLESMANLNLILKIMEHNKDEEPNAADTKYILHKEVRAYLGHQRNHSFTWVSGREWSGLTLCNVLMDDEPLLSEEDYKACGEVFSVLIEENERACIRSAFGLLRGNLFLSNVMRAGMTYRNVHPKQSVLDLHLQRLLRLRACFDYKENGDPKPPLYRFDRLWVLNEIAVTLHLKGMYHDAIMLFRELSEFLEREEEPEAAVDADNRNFPDSSRTIEQCRIKLNMGCALIERGNFAEAQRVFDAVEHLLTDLFVDSYPYPANSSASRSAESGDCLEIGGALYCAKEMHPELLLLLALCRGYVALVKRLAGKLDKAKEIIGRVLSWSNHLDIAGLRSWLHAQAAMIYAGCDESELAMDHFRRAKLESRHAQRPDLLLSLEITGVEMQVHEGRLSDASATQHMLRDLSRCNDDATRLGSDKYLTSAALVRARAMLALSQVEGARKSLLQAICLSMRNGMRLRRLSGLVQYCALMALRGEISDARLLLAEVRDSAESIRYLSAVVDIERLDRQMEIDGGVQAWARHSR